MEKIITGILIIVILSGCGLSEEEIQKRVNQTQVAFGSIMTQSVVPSTPKPTLTSTSTSTSTPIPTSTLAPTVTPTSMATPTLAADAWKTMPVIPAGISSKMCQVYQLGQMMGNKPNAFSKVGDCQSMPPNFLGYIDEGYYNVGEYTSLQSVIDTFSGSFGRNSLAAKNGLTASAVMVPLWNDWKECGVWETPLECEYRIFRPSFAIISFGTNDANGVVPFETTLRRVISSTMGHGVIPILVTKADNAEGDNSINSTIGRLAYEYEIPLWNFWLAVQPLPGHGLQAENPEHITSSEFILPTDFSKPE